MKAKRASESYTEQVQILMPGTMNGHRRLFGGQLMSWIDVLAGVVARRHSRRNVTTAVVDTLTFLGPAYENDTIVLCGTVTYVGRTSMEVRVQTFVEELSGEKRLINTAYLIMVALDENDNPTEVAPLLIETDEQRREWEAAKKRNELRKKRRNEEF